jgi:hypothetical protein
MKPAPSEKICLCILVSFCLAFTSIMLNALMHEPSYDELIRVFNEGISLPIFWGSILTPALTGVAIAGIAISKEHQNTSRLIVLSYSPAITLSVIIATIGIPVTGAFLLLSLTWLLYNSLGLKANN